MKKKVSKMLIGLAIIILVSFTGLVAKIYNQSNIDEAKEADVIVVLGASQWNGRPSPVLEARLNHALFLYNQNLSSKIILTTASYKSSASNIGTASLNFSLPA